MCWVAQAATLDDVFDAEQYADDYADLKAALDMTVWHFWNHYRIYGMIHYIVKYDSTGSKSVWQRVNEYDEDGELEYYIVYDYDDSGKQTGYTQYDPEGNKIGGGSY